MPQKVLTQSGLPALWARVEALTRSAVTALQELINTKADTTALANYSPTNHTHSYNDLTDLPDTSATGTTDVIAAVTTCQPVMQLLLSCPDSAETFWQWQSGVGQGIATYAGIDSQDLRDCQTLGAVIASSTAMSAVAASSTAMSAVVKSETASQAVANVISNYRSQVISTCSNTAYFSRSSKNVGSGSGNFTDGDNTNTVYIPTSCYDDNDTDYTVYNLQNNDEIASCSRHNGDQDISEGVALRGVSVVGRGASLGYVTFEVYTAK